MLEWRGTPGSKPLLSPLDILWTSNKVHFGPKALSSILFYINNKYEPSDLELLHLPAFNTGCCKTSGQLWKPITLHFSKFSLCFWWFKGVWSSPVFIEMIFDWLGHEADRENYTNINEFFILYCLTNYSEGKVWKKKEDKRKRKRSVNAHNRINYGVHTMGTLDLRLAMFDYLAVSNGMQCKLKQIYV